MLKYFIIPVRYIMLRLICEKPLSAVSSLNILAVEFFGSQVSQYILRAGVKKNN